MKNLNKLMVSMNSNLSFTLIHGIFLIFTLTYSSFRSLFQSQECPAPSSLDSSIGRALTGIVEVMGSNPVQA